MTAANGSTRRAIPLVMALDYLRFAFLTWLVLLAAVLAGILLLDALGVSAVRESAGSIWAYVMQAAAWYVAGMLGYHAYWVVPTYVGNGRTRKAAARNSLLALVGIVLGATALIVTGFLVEYSLLGALRWPRHVPEALSFASHLDVLGMMGEFVPQLLVGGAGGAFVGAMVYRNSSWGWLSFLPALLFAITYGALAKNELGLFPEHAFTGATALAVPWLAALLVAGILLALAWLTVRDMPVRPG